MAGEHRQTPDPVDLLQQLHAEVHRFGFFSALRALDCHFRNQPRTGMSERAKSEAFRVGQEPSLRFAASTLASFEQRPTSGKWRLATYFFGLFGPNGALPTHLTDFAQQRIANHHDETFARFADLFHHRMACFFYRAWAAGQPTVQLDRPDGDRFADYVAALCGLGQPALRHRDAMPDFVKLSFCGFLGGTTRHASGLQAILRSYFDVPVQLVPFIAHWIRLPEDCVWRLGQPSQANRLGVSLTLGARVSDCQQRFRIVVGPLSYERYCQLLPFGTSMRRLRAIVDQYAGRELSWDVQLQLTRQQTPRLMLGRQGHLGWTAWLASRPPSADRADLVVEPCHERKYSRSPAKRDDFVPDCPCFTTEPMRV